MGRHSEVYMKGDRKKPERPMGTQSHKLSNPDRKDCLNSGGCRSPYACDHVNRCAEVLTPPQEKYFFVPGRGR